MQNRERGAAHINIYFFLVVLLLFLGTLWFGYLQMSKVNTAEEEARRQIEARLNAQMELTHLQHYVEEISNVIGEKGEWKGKSGFNYEERMKSDYAEFAHYWTQADRVAPVPSTPKALPAVSVPDQVKSKLESLAKGLGLASSSSTPIGPFLGAIKNLHDSKVAAVAKAEADVKAAQQQTAQLNATFNQATQKAQQDAAKKDSDYTSSKNALVSANQQKDQRLAAAQDQVKKTNEAAATERDNHAAVVKGFIKERDKDRSQLEAYVRRDAIRHPPQRADGSVISASMKASRGWIDIGKKDMLFRGTKFRITNANGTKVKGHGEVIELKQDRAEVRLYGVVDRIGDPIARGDKIYNDLYSPNMKRNVAMIGRFSYPYTKPMVKKLLERLGNKVHDNVKVGVDLVIVGLQEPTEAGDALKPVEETPGYKEAQRLHCEIITLAKIRDLLQLSDN